MDGILKMSIEWLGYVSDDPRSCSGIYPAGLGLKDHRDLAANPTDISYQGSILELSFGDVMQVSLTGISANEVLWDFMEVISQ
jgi:hypothetical protein